MQELNVVQDGLLYKVILDGDMVTDKLLIGREKTLFLQLETKEVGEKTLLIGDIFLSHWEDGQLKINGNVRVEVNGKVLKAFETDDYGKVDFQLDISNIQPEETLFFITEDGVVGSWFIESLPQPTEIEILQQENLMLQIALAESIEKQEIDKVNNQIALAELVETLIIKGVL